MLHIIHRKGELGPTLSPDAAEDLQAQGIECEAPRCLINASMISELQTNLKFVCNSECRHWDRGRATRLKR